MKQAGMVMSTNLSLAIGGALIICGVQGLPLTDVLFEVFSAIGTVGMTTGITRDLNALSACIVAFLMYCGRVGSVPISQPSPS